MDTINERIEEMDTKGKITTRLGDIHISPAQQNGGLVVKHTALFAPEVLIAAFTTPDAMLAWLAEQYGVEIKPRVLAVNYHWGEQPPTPFVPSGDIRDAKTREEAAPRYVWKIREDFVAALTMALSVYDSTLVYAVTPAERARKLADIIDSVHAQGVGE